MKFPISTNGLRFKVESVEPVRDFNTGEAKKNDEGKTQVRIDCRIPEIYEDKDGKKHARHESLTVKTWVAKVPELEEYFDKDAQFKGFAGTTWSMNDKSGISFNAESVSFGGIAASAQPQQQQK